MKWINIAVGIVIIFFLAAFNKRSSGVDSGLLHKTGYDTPLVLLCRPPSRAAALGVSASTIKKIHAGRGQKEMVWIGAGKFNMGSADFPDAMPVHAVSINGFWMDEHEVTNAQFAAFV